jgi:hypothetical protein
MNTIHYKHSQYQNELGPKSFAINTYLRYGRIVVVDLFDTGVQNVSIQFQLSRMFHFLKELVLSLSMTGKTFGGKKSLLFGWVVPVHDQVILLKIQQCLSLESSKCSSGTFYLVAGKLVAFCFAMVNVARGRSAVLAFDGMRSRLSCERDRLVVLFNRCLPLVVASTLLHNRQQRFTGTTAVSTAVHHDVAFDFAVVVPTTST